MKSEEINASFSNNIKVKDIVKINNDQNIADSFKVYIRVKPYMQKEISKIRNSFTSTSYQNNSVISKSLTKDLSNVPSQEKDKIPFLKIENNILYLEDIKNRKNKNNKTFLFDNIFNESSNNQNIFNEAIKPMIDKILIGYNSTALAYGATGTGKTYTIFGDLSSNFGEKGIIFKACDYLFEKIEINKNEEKKGNAETNYLIKISYFEIYNEIVKDLISENASPLMLLEDAQKGVICQNSKELIINDSIELKKIINESNKRRTMASTNQNQFSSRSHAILQMTLEKKIKKINSEDGYEIYNSKFLIVDLAGSERGAEKGKRREEGVNINKSLFTLSNCLNILSEKSNIGKFVPYRDSKLTRLLKDSLGGNIITVMIACISSLSCNYDDTLSTLNYAFKAKKITKKVMKNIKEINFNNLQYKEMVDSLKSQIIQLKNIIKNQEIKLKKQVSIEYIEKENKEEEKIDNKNINSNEIQINVNKNEIGIKNIDNNKQKEVSENKQFNLSQKEKGLSDKNNNKNFVEKNKDISQNFEQEINIDIYNNFIKEISLGNFDINKLKNQIELIKKDKNELEKFLLNDSVRNENINEKYNSIKNIYNKYIEIINEKLVESIEQKMIYNFNIKEITDLNQINNDKISELEKKVKEEKVIEEIDYTKKNIEENNIQKNQIIASIKKNDENKKELQNLLLNLLDSKNNSMDQYIHIIKEKDKLFKITKQYEKEIENYVKIQKQKDEDINKINRKIEILRAKLKEKDKKINELEKKGGKPKLELNDFKSNNINRSKLNENIRTEAEKKNRSPKITLKNYFNSFKRNNSKNNTKEKNEILSSSIKGQRKTLIQKKISYSHVTKEKNITNSNYNSNQSNINTKRLSTIPNKNKIKDSKKTNNINKTENNDENINNCNFNDFIELMKYKDSTIPKTTITLADFEHSKKVNNSIHLKSNKSKNNNKFKNFISNKPKNINKNVKIKCSSKNRDNSKTNSINNNSEVIMKNKKNLIKSVTVDLKRKNNSPEIKVNEILEKSKTDQTKERINKKNNFLIIKSFKPEKLSIDLNNIRNQNFIIQADLTEKINEIKISKTKNIKNQKSNREAINRNLKNMKSSKSNPKLLIEKKVNKNFIKKLSLKEARFENKLKYEKETNRKNELNVAENFINQYKQMKDEKSIQVLHSFKNKNNNSSKALLYNNKIAEDVDNESSITNIQRNITDKFYSGYEDIKSNGNEKEV